MLRFTLAARIALIVVVGLTAVWIISIAVFFRQQHLDQANSWPLPERVAAIAALVESQPKGSQRALLIALATPELALELHDSNGLIESRQGLEMGYARVADFYQHALEGRSLAIKPYRARWREQLPHTPGLRSTRIGEISIGLRSQQVLVLAVSDGKVFTAFGLPVGLAAGMFGTLVAFGALLVMQRETRPLARLAAAVDRVDLGKEMVPLPSPKRSAPEIRALITAFDRLQTRLGGLLRARMAMIGGISHDVRSFATRLRLRVERIEDETERSLAITDIEDMIRLLDDALLASRAGAGELRQEMLDLPELVRDEIQSRPFVNGPAAFHASTTEPNIIVLGDRLALRRVVNNLVDNAIAYGSEATVSVRRDGDCAVLQVEDTGPGIPEGSRAAMLEPFSRLDTSRARSTGGAGLGLAVVRSLVEGHGGTVEIDQASSGGALLVVRLPIFQSGN